MDRTFFHAKRPWSVYKDSILNYYLDPYIPKVATQQKPILIVDCFAGCGRFEDGTNGSPVIICETIRKWREKGFRISGEFIEADPINFASLKHALQPYSAFADCHHSTFAVRLADLTRKAQTHSLFLYVDPYSVRGLKFQLMRQVFEQIRASGSSVEVLLNWNPVAFLRWGKSALKSVADETQSVIDSGGDFLADDPEDPVQLTELDEIAGGPYWRSIASNSTISFAESLNRLTEAYCQSLHGSFAFVARYPVKEKYKHTVPKYFLVFGTRHPDGIELMNDAMCSARRAFLGSEFVTGRLFDTTPDEEIADLTTVKAAIRVAFQARREMTRKELRQMLFLEQNLFGKYRNAEINCAVGEMLKAKGPTLYSKTGRTRINDGVQLALHPFGMTAPR